MPPTNADDRFRTSDQAPALKPKLSPEAPLPDAPPAPAAGSDVPMPPASVDPYATRPGGAEPQPIPLAARMGWPTPPGYEILDELGRGGMGVVYKARQLDLGRLVALKMVLAGGHAGPEELARFRAEAEAIARLQHPNIVQIYEVGEHDGLPFFSLEFCPGGSLAQELDGTPLQPREAASVVERLARAMAAATPRG
jgi:serine/threonine protein kinase